jgi:hypothetical protein
MVTVRAPRRKCRDGLGQVARFMLTQCVMNADPATIDVDLDGLLADADTEHLVDALLPADTSDALQAARRATLSPAWTRLSEAHAPQNARLDFEPRSSGREMSKPVAPVAPWLRDGAFDSTSQRKLK